MSSTLGIFLSYFQLHNKNELRACHIKNILRKLINGFCDDWNKVQESLKKNSL